MNRLLERQLVASQHLVLLDKIFQQNHPVYAETSKKLQTLPLYDELLNEIYVGGKKKGIYGYGRQMILGDLLQYILCGRGYYFAIRGESERETFTKILMYVCNLLILMEDISVDVHLRNKLLDTLKQEMSPIFLQDAEQEKAFSRLRAYKGIIVREEGREHEDIFDSLLPKRVGGVPELLVYAYLVRKNYGYVIPLLQAQRLLGNRGFITPPDFLLLRRKGEIFGLEVGIGKERQIASFSTVTSIPVFTVGIGSPEQPQPYRCGKCQKWIIYCDEAISLCAKNEDSPGQEYIDCAQCSIYKDVGERCPRIVYYGRAQDYSGQLRELRYHYNCVREDREVQLVLSRARKARLIAPLPWVSGIEHLQEDV